jgi:HTH-type transcriptional regulator / antitoxin HigA
MDSLKYKVIKTKKQYNEYCKVLDALSEEPLRKKGIADEIELLTFLIEKWDMEHNSFADTDPIILLKSLMIEHSLQAKDLSAILNVSKGLVSDILNYKKGISKEVIRTLSSHFRLSQEAFNRPYKLKLPINAHLRNASVMNTTKELEPLH